MVYTSCLTSCRISLFHMKTRVCLKYYVNDCSLQENIAYEQKRNMKEIMETKSICFSNKKYVFSFIVKLPIVLFYICRHINIYSS